MTHDELLNDVVYGERTKFALANALRAVVELHKPWNNGDEDICQECANLIDPWSENCYPCPTIQAIEGELV
jgi:hypothetical protein